MIAMRVNFNIPVGDRHGPTDRRLTDAWMAYRCDLFRRYTLASLQRQTVGDWRVLLRCDGVRADACEALIAPLDEPRVQVCYDYDGDSRRLAAETGPLIFGRLDSDDLLAPDALARWQRERQPGLVQFGDGYCLDLRDGRLFEWNHPSASVLARIGDRTMCRSGRPALGGNHGQVYKIARRIDDGRYYMVTVHGDNVCNRLPCQWSGRRLHGPERDGILAAFGVEDAWAALSET